MYVCSPANPSGRVLTLDDWRALFERSDRHGFVIASDECYSEIYDDAAPLGALEAAQQLGRDGFPNLVVFNSLSKRSNAPGLRAGAVAGDAALLQQFLLYRTYHGCAMSLVVQHASMAAWNDEAHVAENRRLYRQKFDALVPMLEAGHGGAAARGRLLSVGACAGRRRRGVRARLVRRHARDRAARAVSRPRRARHEPGARLRADGARARTVRLRRGGPAHRGVLSDA